MTPKDGLFRKFTIALAASLAVVGGLSIAIVSISLERNMLERAQTLSARVVKEEVDKEIGVIEPAASFEAALLEKLRSKSLHLNFGPDVRHVKFWSPDRRVIWSDREEVIGERSPGNEELDEALGGAIVSEVSSGNKYPWEKDLPEKILEIYVPLHVGGGDQVDAVAEIYQDLLPLYNDIFHHRTTVVAVAGSSFVALFLLLSGIVWRASEKIDSQSVELQRSYEEMAKASEEWRETFDTISEAITIHDLDFNIIQANRGARRLLDMPPAGEKGPSKCFAVYHGTDVPPEGCASCGVLGTGLPASLDVFEPHLGRHLQINAFPRFGLSGDISGLVHVVHDVTELKKAEQERERLQQQLSQAQKMESVGRLAGGIAHDFNNLLTAIIGYGELLLADMAGDGEQKEQMEIILAAGEKASALTRQLLAFSRQQVLEMKVVNLRTVVEQMSRLLRRTIGEDVALDLKNDSSTANVRADPGQLEQIIMNLVVNARDAIPRGGRILVETGNTVLDKEQFGNYANFREGPYVMLAVTDTGAGMSREVQERIFEPFFTTKEKGQGTGLGLATVYGIVKQHDGFIFVNSEIGRGTTFKAFFPAVSVAEQDVPVKHRDSFLQGGTERILLVEDDPVIRRLIVDTLGPGGYRVTAAGSGGEALQLCEGEEPFDLLLTDVVMPGMSGIDLAGKLKGRFPGLRIVFMSGYTDAAISRYGGIEEGCSLLQKPLTPGLLLRKIREALET